MFSYNKQGNITFNGEPYIHSSLGSSDEGQRRAARFAKWLNECLKKAQEGKADEGDIICSCGHKARYHSEFSSKCAMCGCENPRSEVIAAYKQALT